MYRRLGSASVLIGALVFAPATPALAAPSTAERQANCTAAGGTFTGSSNPNAGQRCRVVTSVDGPAVPSGAPTVTMSADRPVGAATSVAVTNLVGEPTSSERIEDSGNATSSTVDVAGEPTVSAVTRDAGPATTVATDVPSGPSVSTVATRREESVTTTAPGPPINCRRVNNERSPQSVQRCDRTEVDTTVTQTTLVTTTVTPMQTVTTTTQPRETVTTTTTPFTPTTTTVQPRTRVVTTTQQTEVVTTTTQPTERTVTTTQPTSITTTTTTSSFSFNDSNLLVPSGTPTVTTSTRAGSSTTTSTVPGTPQVTTTRMPGDPIVTEQRFVADPRITVTTGSTRTESVDVVTPASSVITVDRTPTADTVVLTEAPGPPIIEPRTRVTGSCVQNPGQGDRENAC